MLEQRLRAPKRVPGAVCLTKAFARGYRLRFHKKSVDKSGKCNIVQTGSMEDVVHGVLFEIPEAQRRKLDAAEGYGQGYDHADIQVHLPDGTTESALVYVADFNAIDDEKVPYSWYHELVVAGAEQHGLPADYIARLREQRSVKDSEPNRDSKVEAEKVLSEYYATRKRTWNSSQVVGEEQGRNAAKDADPLS